MAYNKGYYTLMPMLATESKPCNSWSRQLGRDIRPHTTRGNDTMYPTAPGLGFQREAYTHWRKTNDVYSDVKWGRPATRAAPPMWSDNSVRAAGVPAAKPPLVIMQAIKQ